MPHAKKFNSTTLWLGKIKQMGMKGVGKVNLLGMDSVGEVLVGYQVSKDSNPSPSFYMCYKITVLPYLLVCSEPLILLS